MTKLCNYTLDTLDYFNLHDMMGKLMGLVKSVVNDNSLINEYVNHNENNLRLCSENVSVENATQDEAGVPPQ